MSTLPATTKPKNKLLSMIRDKHPGFHPALILAELALDEDKSIQLKAAKALLPYIEPQLKSIEVISDKNYVYLLKMPVTHPRLLRQSQKTHQKLT